MTVKTSYSDATLLTYMISVLGSAGDVLGLTTASTIIVEAMDDILFDYGVTATANATDIKKLRTLARFHSWKSAKAEASLDYDFSDAGASYKRSQMFDHVVKQYLQARRDAMLYLPDYQVESDELNWTGDPLEYHEPGTYSDPKR